MNLELSRNQGASLHHQIMIVLRSQIYSGQLPDGALVPSEMGLMTQYSVSRATVRRALLTLEQEGLIARRQGRGTRVTFDAADKPRGIAYDIQRIETLAAKTTVKVLAFEWAMPPPAARDGLQIAVAEEALRIVRVRYAGETPLRYIVNFVPRPLGENMRRSQFTMSSLLAIFKQLGHEPQQFDDTIGAVAADPDLARALEVQIGAPLIELSRVIRGAQMRPLAHQWTIIPPARGLLRTSIKAENE